MTFVKLKRGTYMDNGLIYLLYPNQGQGPITLGFTSLDRFYNLLLMKNFCYRFLRNCECCKIKTWYKGGQLADVLYVPELGPRTCNSWSYIP